MANAFISSITALFRGVRSALVRSGVNIGGTADYPRVELHSFTENPPVDKDARLRSVDLTVECISDRSLGDISGMVAENISRLFGSAGLSVDGFRVAGIVPGQLRLLDEQVVQDSAKVIYRLLQEVTVWLEAITPERTDDTAEEPANVE